MFTYILPFLFVTSLLSMNGFSQNKTIESFQTAKKKMEEVYSGHEITLYCGCSYNGKTVNTSKCGFVSKKESSRSKKIEWEHIVPAHAFGQSFKEWRDGSPKCISSKRKPYKGRKCATKASTEFARMEADLYNLAPAIGEINQRRSNYSMAMIPGEDREFGKCDVEIKDKKIEPRPEIRGDIARTYLYMDFAYPGHGIISEKNRKLFEAWVKEDPVDDWELERARRIEKIQGNKNPFITEHIKLTH